jgi:hypothetical protein
LRYRSGLRVGYGLNFLLRSRATPTAEYEGRHAFERAVFEALVCLNSLHASRSININAAATAPFHLRWDSQDTFNALQ